MTGSVATGKAIMKSAAEHMTKVSSSSAARRRRLSVRYGLDLAVPRPARRWRYRDGSVPRRRGPRPRGEGHRGVAHLLLWARSATAAAGLVHESIKTEFLNKLVAAMESVKVGAPADDGVDICGLVSSMQFDKVKGMVDRAVAGRRQGRVRRRYPSRS